jgi:hypothetical protein
VRFGGELELRMPCAGCEAGMGISEVGERGEVGGEVEEVKRGERRGREEGEACTSLCGEGGREGERGARGDGGRGMGDVGTPRGEGVGASCSWEMERGREGREDVDEERDDERE